MRLLNWFFSLHNYSEISIHIRIELIEQYLLSRTRNWYSIMYRAISKFKPTCGHSTISIVSCSPIDTKYRNSLDHTKPIILPTHSLLYLLLSSDSHYCHRKHKSKWNTRDRNKNDGTHIPHI